MMLSDIIILSILLVLILTGLIIFSRIQTNKNDVELNTEKGGDICFRKNMDFGGVIYDNGYWFVNCITKSPYKFYRFDIND